MRKRLDTSGRVLLYERLWVLIVEDHRLDPLCPFDFRCMPCSGPHIDPPVHEGLSPAALPNLPGRTGYQNRVSRYLNRVH